MTRFLSVLGFLSLVFFASSCVSTQKTTYFNNAEDTTFVTRADETFDAPILRNDILSVTISSANAEASSLFNTNNNYQTSSTTSTGSTNSATGYLVSNEGYIQFLFLVISKLRVSHGSN